MLLGFPEYATQTRALAAAARRSCAIVDIHRFPDGESRVRLPPALPEAVVLCRSLDAPNERLVELLIAADAARELGAAHVTLIAPYLCYMRQDMAFSPGEAVSQRIIGRLLAAHFERVITVDPHLHRIADLREAIPCPAAIALSAAVPIAAWLKARLAGANHAPLIIGPDSESRQWVDAIAAASGLEGVVGAKVRRGDTDVEIDLPDIDLAGREIVLVDDMISTGSTMAITAGRCRARGARAVDVVVTHGLFKGDAVDRLHQAGAGRVVSTDSVSHPTNAIPLARLLADALAAAP